MQIANTCVQCEKKLLMGKRRYCNDACKWEYNYTKGRLPRIITHCLFCKAELSGRIDKKYCNIDCKNMHYNSGSRTFQRGKYNKAPKEKVSTSANCETCGDLFYRMATQIYRTKCPKCRVRRWRVQ